MIYLMRHGQDDESFIGGWSDVSLIDSGKKDVKNTAEWIRDNLHIKSIQCSDVNRAIETAKIVSETIGVPYTLNSNLREQNKGKLNGVLKDKAYALYPEYKDVEVDTVFPEGESLRDLYNRIKDYIDEIMKFEDDTLIITHRGVINMIYYILNNKDVDMNKKQFGVETASVHELDNKNKTVRRIK